MSFYAKGKVEPPRVVAYTVEEGGEWLKWPHGEMRPSNPVLLTHKRNNVAHLPMGTSYGKIMYMKVHTLAFSNGEEWDSLNGYREEEFRVYGHSS